MKKNILLFGEAIVLLHDSSSEALQAFRAAFPGIYQDIKVGQPIKMADR